MGASRRRLVAAVLALCSVGRSEWTQWDATCEKAYTRANLTAMAAQVDAVKRVGDGVVYAAGGNIEFWMQEVVPTVKYLKRLEVKRDAAVQFYLLAEGPLIDGMDAEDYASFLDVFDTVQRYEDVAVVAYPRDVKLRVKALKLTALVFAPFERLVYLDFDSRPCRFDFATVLLGQLDDAAAVKTIEEPRRPVDALLHNQWERVQRTMRGPGHYRIEHNSAILVLDARRDATRAALAALLPAFDRLRDRRDQPALMVALRHAHETANFTHSDVDAQTFCRKNTSDIVSCDAGCLVVHKPAKYDPGALVVGVGLAGTGAAALRRVLEALKIVDDPACGVSGAGACRILVDAKFADPAVYAGLARRFPRAKFVLTRSHVTCDHEEDHGRRVRAAIEPHRLFELDLATAADDPAGVWPEFCAFVEAWSPCKTAALTKVASAWMRARVNSPCATT